MKATKIVRRRRARKTVETAPVVSTPSTPLESFTSVAEMLKAMGMQIVPISAPQPQIAPIVTQAITPIPPPRPRKLYSLNPHPSPLNPGEAVSKVYSFLQKGESTQRKLEEGTGLTEGQIKGALRELRLGGFLLDREEPAKGS